MLNMKKDMGGAATALALAHMIMARGLKMRLRVLIPAVENSIAGGSFRPRDIYTSRKGITVEIGNTDAEGRLILADALALADEDKPELIADFATLTGAARVALGPDVPPFFTDDDELAAELMKYAACENDPLWRLPLWRPYEAMLESKVADINNVGGSHGGAITAALFMRRFVTAKSWLHIDAFAWTPSARAGPAGGRRVSGSARSLRAARRPLRLSGGGKQKEKTMRAFDPRVTPARADLAAKHLQGKVTAARYVEGRVYEVIEPRAPLRLEPRPDAPLLTEALKGERVTIYDANAEGWAWGQLAADNYVGWMPANALAPPVAPPTHKVAALRTLVFPGPSIKLPPLEALPLGAKLAIARTQDGMAVTQSGVYVPEVHLKPIDENESDFVAVAERFLGVPYLWGGKTSLGLDCSGLVQIALTACGLSCPRDSDMQEQTLGRLVAAAAGLSRFKTRRPRVLERARRNRPRARQFHPRQRISLGGCDRTDRRRNRAHSRRRQRDHHRAADRALAKPFRGRLGLARMLAGSLRKKENTSNDNDGDDRRCDRTAESKSAVTDRFVEEIADSGAKRPRQDEGGPEQKDPRDVRPDIGGGKHRQSGGEYKRAVFISSVIGHPIAESSSQRLGECNRYPIECFHLRRGDCRD